ncbi:MAG: hypothetical protein WD645_06245 [Dehalococcoidia bacterium]
MADPEFDREMAEAIASAEAAEVVCVIFPMINQCLVYDSRFAPSDPPRVSVSPPLGSAERRLRHVNKARPHMKHARDLAVIPWTGSIGSMVDSEVWHLIVTRMAASGDDESDSKCVQALEDLRRWERRTLVQMINGQGPYHTIWARAGV